MSHPFLKVIHVNTEHESIVIKVWTDKGNINNINYYNLCRRFLISEDIFKDTVRPLQDSVICGNNNRHTSCLVIELFIDDHCLGCITQKHNTIVCATAL